ncbi:MAG TPA: substrate-binding domain-containing protein [Nocardioidaceae bacterium]|nr:substrate-binding domain-containing protein [Nocardioidaceae bacterium]
MFTRGVRTKKAMVAALGGAMALALAGCGSSGSGGGGGGGGQASGGGGASSSGLKVAVLLPDTQSSARYVTQDAPDFKAFFESQGMTEGKDFTVENAKGDPAQMRTQADQAIQQGATVLVIDGIDSGSAAAIEKSAQSKGVATIDYDRLTLNGSASYYVSFDNVEVGKMQGQGLVDCIKNWNVKNPNVLEVQGAPTDNNGTLFAKGSDSVLDPLYKNGTYTKVGEQRIDKWDPNNARTYFEQQYQAHSDINAVLVANDDMANGVITAMKAKNIPPKTIPTTGQDATVGGLQNILAGYQCMTVYKPIKSEAEAAGKLALALVNGEKNPPGVNGKVNNGQTDVPSVLLKPIAVTTDNMADTVVKDGFVKVSDLCKGSYASKCKAAGIS